MIVIGSKALLSYFPVNFATVTRYMSKDYDVIMSYEEFEEWERQNREYIQTLIPSSSNKYKALMMKDGKKKLYEIELAFEGTSAEYLLDHQDIVADKVDTGFFGEEMHVLIPLYQMLTKRSHLVYPVHFEKNVEDYHVLKKIVGDVELDSVAEAYFALRSAEAKERYSKFKTPKLNVSTEDFFSSKLAVEHFFVHDHIHEIVAHHDSPVYTLTQTDSTSAWCSKKLFFELPYDMQIQMVQEEGYAIALERYIVPKAGENWRDYFLCYRNAIKRICTTLTSGWFRDFSIENYDVVIDRYDPEFVYKFNEAFKAGKIKTIDNKQWSLSEEGINK